MTSSRQSASPVRGSLARIGSLRRRGQGGTLRIELLGTQSMTLKSVFPHNVKARDLLEAWARYVESKDPSVAVDADRIELHSSSGPVPPQVEVNRLLFLNESATRPDEIDISLRVMRKTLQKSNGWRRMWLLGVNEPRAGDIIHINVVNAWGDAMCCLDVPRYIQISEVKRLIERKTGYPAQEQRLLFKMPNEVYDELSLDHYVPPGRTYVGLVVKLDVFNMQFPDAEARMVQLRSLCARHL